MSASETTATVRTYELEIAIDAPRDAVWRALTEEANDWWLPDFRMVGEGSVVTFEASAGGQLVERTKDGKSLLWWTVQMCTPLESLHLFGHIAPQWGGPNTTMLHLALEERAGGTLLRVQDALFGHTTETGARSLEDGWRLLFTDGLKRHVERN